MSLADLTAQSVRLAIDEFRRTDRKSFLKKYGFGKAIRFLSPRATAHLTRRLWPGQRTGSCRAARR